MTGVQTCALPISQAGAFGGSREAIMAAENERNRNMGLQSIIGQGYNQAFNAAQQQYNQNLQNQLAALNTAGQAATTLGQLGQNQYAQLTGNINLQNALGTQQQQQQQNIETAKYQDWLSKQAYPQQQMDVLASYIRGTPMTTQSASTYAAPPSTV